MTNNKEDYQALRLWDIDERNSEHLLTYISQC